MSTMRCDELIRLRFYYIYARNELNKLIAIATTSFLISSTKLCVDIHCIEMYYSKNELLLLSQNCVYSHTHTHTASSPPTTIAPPSTTTTDRPYLEIQPKNMFETPIFRQRDNNTIHFNDKGKNYVT